VHVADDEYGTMAIIDFGLGDLRREGVQYIDILLSDALRITVLVLLPNQTLPQHVHPPYEGCAGKEESVRVLYGEFRVYTRGADTVSVGHVPRGKEPYYTARHEHVLQPVQSQTIAPGVPHWFQAGPAGAVTLGFYNRVDETRNVFADPAVTAICGTGAPTAQGAAERKARGTPR
jgi:D-lyxose ketol-isomerase